MNLPIQSEMINELITALSKAQSEIMPAIKDSNNPFFKSKYADLSSVWEACRPALTKYNLAIVQSVIPSDIPGESIMVTTLAHCSGQWIRSYMPIVCNKKDTQGFGSALTYMRRYSLAAIVGVTPEDDDGELSQGRTQTKLSIEEANEIEGNLILLLEDNESYFKEYLTYFCKTQKCTVAMALTKLNANQKGFIDHFNAWFDKNHQSK